MKTMILLISVLIVIGCAGQDDTRTPVTEFKNEFIGAMNIAFVNKNTLDENGICPNMSGIVEAFDISRDYSINGKLNDQNGYTWMIQIFYNERGDVFSSWAQSNQFGFVNMNIYGSLDAGGGSWAAENNCFGDWTIEARQ